MQEFAMKTKIYMGTASLEKLKDLDLENTFIICDPFMEKSGKINTITSILKERNINYSVFSKIVPNPTIDIVAQGLEEMKRINPTTVIAFGGGSAIDSAKAICKVYEEINNFEKMLLIAIPTTSGTGSEVTEFSVITDPKLKVKYALVDEEMLPDIAILDSQFTVSVPSNITADTGMDVLTHAIEAYVSTKSGDFSDAFAEKAIKLVNKYLIDVVKDGSNIKAREHMHNASAMAGIAFNAASLGICHSMAHSLGGRFNLSHGRINAMLLPYIISYNAGLEEDNENSTLDRYVEISKLMGISHGAKKATVHGLIREIRKIMKKIGIPLSIKETNIDLEEYRNSIKEMAKNALKDNCTITNPRQASEEDIEKIYLRLLNGA